MAKSWKKRMSRRLLGWLGHIEGVEKPAILVGLGVLLFRTWRNRKSDGVAEAPPPATTIFTRVRDRLRRPRAE